ncbi:Uncharacterised protein [Mobiluncus mulieris]|uniref:hypothetical protein n=1 Tax=Mobiluncus mulieris TaxID=2052 RepID=UPI00019F8D9A|nr:hypothetical protein [Mobiluncus mulieris]EEJ54684.1 hypothetical protein HMPREF0577_0207 [Mobiluncus mulieris ATCC 35243]SPX76763.1 Uncharacterised protein [Mobiluncus mulieris]
MRCQPKSVFAGIPGLPRVLAWVLAGVVSWVLAGVVSWVLAGVGCPNDGVFGLPLTVYGSLPPVFPPFGWCCSPNPRFSAGFSQNQQTMLRIPGLNLGFTVPWKMNSRPLGAAARLRGHIWSERLAW